MGLPRGIHNAFDKERQNASDPENHAMPVVRHAGGGRRAVLHRHFREFAHHQRFALWQAGREIHGKPAGSVLAVAFELEGQAFSALNGGPQFKFTEAISLQVTCENQEEVDRYWEKLSEGGDKHAQQCGWLKDKYGLSWQIVPRVLFDMLSDPDKQKSQRAMTAMLQMKKLDIAALERAYAG
jgi:predicted 3-demethylubiquinone-9 3-methyltransferase (glyoxalase superfamily)